MRFRVVVGYEYPVEHKPPVKAEIILHGDRVVTDNIELLEQEPATKNDLADDCISREAVDRIINKWLSHPDYELKDHIYSMTEKIHNLPTVTLQEPILDKIYADIQRLRGCSCSCSDGIIDDVEDILDKYKAETEVEDENGSN